MKINRDNCEAYFLDYHEGQLSLEMVRELHLFIEQNPDLKNSITDFEIIPLSADQDIIFGKKPELKKNPTPAIFQVNELNYEEYLICETEGLLSPEQLNILDEFLSLNPRFVKDRKLYALTHLHPDDEIVFESKQSLKQKAIPLGAIHAENFETYLARELEGDLDQDEVQQVNEFMLLNPHLENDRTLYKQTILSVEHNITFGDKDSLKRSKTEVTRILYYALSAAAVIALIFSAYFLLDRNNISKNIPDQGIAKKIINNEAGISTHEIPANQVASTKLRPADLTSNPTLPAQRIFKASINPNINKDRPDQPIAIDKRHPVEPLKCLSANDVTSRQYVDPQFTFIRTSQMYMNQNTEFYYNLKLSEEIQFAELNAKDLKPGKTIFDAATGKIGSLFAINQASEPVKEKPSFSFWSFAELGVQTFNNITSSELELKLHKDDEGKVTAYGLQSGLLDFEKEVKK